MKTAPLRDDLVRVPHSRPGFGLGWGLWLRPSPWAASALALAVAAVCVPYFLTHNLLLIGVAMRHAFSLVCHQRPERSFWLFGAPIAVCARCLGIYLGAAIGLLLRTSRRIALNLLVLAAALNLLDAITEFAGLHGNWLSLRLALGLALGAAGALLISSSLLDCEAVRVS